MDAFLTLRIKLRALAIAAALGLAACSAGANTTAPTTSGSPQPTAIAKIKLSQVTSTPAAGRSGSFEVAVTAYDISGNAITGTYASPVTLTTNDTTDLTINQTSVTQGNTNDTVAYNGAALPSGTTISASAGTVTASVAIASGSSTSTTQQIGSISIAPVAGSGNLVVGYNGSLGIVVTVKDTNNNVISGTYLEPITLTVNDATDLTFNGSATTTITSSASAEQTVLYDGKSLPPSGAIFTASAPGITASSFSVTAANPQYSTPAIASMSLVPQGLSTLAAGIAGSFAVTVTAYGPDAQPIVTGYPLPVILTTNNTSALSFSSSTTATVNSGNSPITVLYAGTVLVNGVQVVEPLHGDTITASVVGAIATTVTIP